VPRGEFGAQGRGHRCQRARERRGKPGPGRLDKHDAALGPAQERHERPDDGELAGDADRGPRAESVRARVVHQPGEAVRAGVRGDGAYGGRDLDRAGDVEQQRGDQARVGRRVLVQRDAAGMGADASVDVKPAGG
jgi:hypothetical protein